MSFTGLQEGKSGEGGALSGLRKLLAVSGSAVGAVGLLAALNRRLEASGGSVLSGGERRYHRWRGGEISYSVSGDGPPLLMVHGIYVGASSEEFAENVRGLSEDFRVYAVDLLGCGGSEKPAREYRPGDVTDQVEDFVKEVIGTPTHLVANSLSGALAISAVVSNPRLFRKVVLICPTGYRALDRPSGRLGGFVYEAFRLPVIGDTLYHALASRRSIRYYLEKTAYHDPEKVTDEVVEAYYRASHGKGAKYLPAAFASGKLNFGVAGYWPRVANRTMILWGQQAGAVSSVDQLNDFLSQNPRSAYRIFRDSSLLPHVERPETFNREVREFLTGSA